MKGPRAAGPRAAALALLAWLAAACGGEERPEPSGPDFEGLEADQVMVEVEHYMTRDGVRRAHLMADTVYLLDEGATAHLRHFTVDFFDDQGARTSVLTAVDGLYDMQEGDMRATQDVVVTDSAAAQRLRTEELLYDASSGELRSEVDFVLLRGRDTIRGTGFVTDPGLDSFTTRRPSMVSPPSADEEARPGGTEQGAGGGRRPPEPPLTVPDTAPTTADTARTEGPAPPAAGHLRPSTGDRAPSAGGGP